MPLSIPSLSPLPPSRSDPKRHVLLSLAVMECLVGAGLWVEGQMSGWRCLAGVGYLVVFDAIGVGVSYVGGDRGEGTRSLQRPYGQAFSLSPSGFELNSHRMPRLVALLYFGQSLFLVFAAVYIAKESIEQVVLGSEAHEHPVGGAHGHGEAVIEGDER